MYIKLEDLERHGFTAGCRRCILMREGRSARGVHHRKECRERVEKAMKEAGDQRVERAEQRIWQEVERRAAASAPAEAPAAPEAAAPEAAAPVPEPGPDADAAAEMEVEGDVLDGRTMRCSSS